MRVATVITTQTNSTFKANRGFKVVSADWAEWGGGVQLHVDMNLNEPVENFYLFTIYPGMGIPDNAEFLAVFKNPFMLLYVVPEKA